MNECLTLKGKNLPSYSSPSSDASTRIPDLTPKLLAKLHNPWEADHGFGKFHLGLYL